MQIFLIALCTLLAAGLGACAVMLLRRGRPHSEKPIEGLEQARATIAALDKALAVEKERASRCAALEQELETRTRELSGAQQRVAEVERDLAVGNEARTALDRASDGLSERVAILEAQLAESDAERVRLKVSDSEKGAQLAERDATLVAERETSSALSEQLREASGRSARVETELARTQQMLVNERMQSDEKLKLLTNAQDTLTNQFSVLANQLMSRHGETFAKQNKEQIDGLLEPMRVKMMELQQGLQAAQVESAKERAALGEQIKGLTAVSATMTSETTNLVRALKGKSQTQGAWGEMVLATLLEKSGLRAGEEYHKQVSQQNEEGRRLRPDVIVNLPGGQNIVLDSKVSLVAFEAHVNSEVDEQRETHLRKHVESVRAHIKLLGDKEYQQLNGGGLDYVVMFVPIEGAWSVAVNEAPDLILFAAEHNVTVATPTTLMMSLRTVNSIWKIERRNANAELIADRAGKLYTKLVSFLKDFEQIGSRLVQATESYQGAFSKLSSGPGNLVWQVETLKGLGARTSKTIPAALLGDDSGDEEGVSSDDHQQDNEEAA
ncbi:MAG: DNA recombination protein RmuC [Terricaulis silvestris]